MKQREIIILVKREEGRGEGRVVIEIGRACC